MAGDCLMLGFGVPLEQPDSPQRAVRAATGDARAASPSSPPPGKSATRSRRASGIGINEGDVVAGNIGSTAYMNYTIIGDTVNIAARLCQRARAGEMLFSRALKKSLDAHGLDVGATPLPPMQLRGRSDPIDILLRAGGEARAGEPRAARRLVRPPAPQLPQRLAAALNSGKLRAFFGTP